ncbi:MAG TPA: hypothetical protein PK573_03840 [Spirochaetota bacterium]|nr:hypothetical protein [Spirochaetota bacterium]HRZ26918.1 hypothetical protein [Spirochaetota bacterium]HSA15995.1 hypothetical protein [Spirochaetota bacterium]
MKYNNALTNRIYEILVPVLGDTMAIASIQIQAHKLNISPESITRNDLQPIADAVKKSLVVFLGTDSAAKLAEKIKTIKV